MKYNLPKVMPPKDMPEHLHKYWAQRNRLFLKYEQGIKLDEGMHEIMTKIIMILVN